MWEFVVNGTVLADEGFATKSDTSAIMKRAVAHDNSIGMGESAEDFINLKGDYIDHDLYVTVYNRECVELAHGQNKKSMGNDMIDLKDSDDKEMYGEPIPGAVVRADDTYANSPAHEGEIKQAANKACFL